MLRLKRQLPATLDSIQQVRQLAVTYACEVCELDDELQANIALCVSEAATNAVKHAYDGDHDHATIDLEVYKTPSRLVIQVIDEGAGINEAEPPGTGLRILNQLASLTITSGHGRGAIVAMAFPCPTPRDA
jgi:anti-sigma regulatory factor (Ser/Thr protein kinase)